MKSSQFCTYCMSPVAPGESCPVCGLTEGSYTPSPHHLPPGTVLYARRQDTARAVENLLDNAVRYAAPGGQVTLRCTREADALAFAVQDDGPGFAPAVLRGGGQLLYTGDAARSDGHQGLGLYFARRVAENQGGSLTLANTPTGALVVLRLPPGHAPA